jgi:hypothetical protein
MIRIKEDEENKSQILVGGVMESRTEKQFQCVCCKRNIVFFGSSPLRCPTCQAAQPDVTRMLAGENGLWDRRSFHWAEIKRQIFVD